MPGTETAILVLAGIPSGTHVGIGIRGWQAGERFRGVMGIPAGVHFVFASTIQFPSAQNQNTDRLRDDNAVTNHMGAPRTGFFAVFEPGTVVARAWDARTEDFLSLTELDELLTEKDGVDISVGEDTAEHLWNIQQRERQQRQKLRDELYSLIGKAHDGTLAHWGLGPYPVADAAVWQSLSDYITPKVVSRLGPGPGGSGTISSVYDTGTVASDYEPKDPENPRHARAVRRDRRISDAEAALAAQLRAGRTEEEVKAGDELKNQHRPSFSYVAAQHPPRGLSREAVTIFGVDKTVSLEAALKEGWDGNEDGLLGELQFSFVCFLVGQSYDGFDQWKRLVTVICGSQEVVRRRPVLLWKASRILADQLTHVPLEFFAEDGPFDPFSALSTNEPRDDSGAKISKDSFLAHALRDFLEVLEDVEAGSELNERGFYLRELVNRLFGAEILELRRGHSLLTEATASGPRVEELFSVTRANGSSQISSADFFDSDDDLAPVVVSMDEFSDEQRAFLQSQWTEGT